MFYYNSKWGKKKKSKLGWKQSAQLKKKKNGLMDYVCVRCQNSASQEIGYQWLQQTDVTAQWCLYKTINWRSDSEGGTGIYIFYCIDLCSNTWKNSRHYDLELHYHASMWNNCA